MSEDRDWQRLDKWLWCARFLKARADCARLVEEGSVRVNRQATDKPHAKIRPGDVLTVPLRGDVMVVRVVALAGRRGPAVEARGLYELLEGEGAVEGADGRDGAALDGGAMAPLTGTGTGIGTGNVPGASPGGREEGLRDGGNDCISGFPPGLRSA